MVGDDANIVMVEFIKQLLEIIRNISSNRNSGFSKAHKEKQPKIKFGKLSKKDFNKLKKAGTGFKYVTIPKDNLAEFEQTAKSLGGAFFATELTEGNNAVLAVPEQYINEVNAAAKYVVGQIMKSDPDALVLKDGQQKIDEADMKLITDVMQSHDIPIYSLKSSDGKYMNVVPKEYDGQYEAALQEAREIKAQLDNIEVIRYEQTSPLDSLDYVAETLSLDEAQELYAAALANGLNIQIAKYGEGAAVYYPKELADSVQKALTEYRDSIAESEKYLIDITDDTVTMNIDKLLMSEDNISYFVKIPNTDGQDYMRIPKSDVTVIDGGKTLSVKIDRNKDYPIYDENEHFKSHRKGTELEKSYNTKHNNINRDTSVYMYGDNFNRIDLYCAEKNSLISLGITNAEEIRAELLKQGISPKGAEKLLRDIDKKLPEEYKKVFNFTVEKSEIVYADIPNIGEYLAQSQLSEKVIGKAECHSEIPKGSGKKCCIFDKAANKFEIIPILPRAEVVAKLSEMGYSEVSAKEIADKVIGSYRDSDLVKMIDKAINHKNEKSDIVPMSFEGDNPELSGYYYYNTEDSTIIVQDSGESYGFMEIDKGMTPAEVEKALAKNLSVKDDISAAIIMKQLAADGIIEQAKPIAIGDTAITQLSSKCVEIANGDKSVIIPIGRVDKKKLSEIGIPDKTVNAIAKSFKRAEKYAANPDKQTLRDLEKFAGEARHKLNTAKEKVKEKAQERKSGGQAR